MSSTATAPLEAPEETPTALQQAIEAMKRAMNGSAAIYRQPLTLLIQEAQLSEARAGLLISMGDTNRVLAGRLKQVADRLPEMSAELGRAEDLADDGDHDGGYESCYNAAGNVRSAINGLLRDINPTR